MEKYSVILPVRNGGNYVKECLFSILGQTLNDFNCIVLDNCSDDGTAEWIESLHDRRIVLYRSDSPLTIEQNWSRIKDVPKNEFITLIGHDDFLSPFYLEEMDALISRHPSAGLYQTHYKYIDGEGRLIRPCLPMDEVQYAHEFLACQMARTIDSMGTGYMMRSADYDQAGGIPTYYPNLIFADYELWMNMMRKGYKATSLKDCFSYRLHQNLSRTTNGMLYQEAFGRYVSYIKGLVREDAGVQESVKRYGRDMLLYFCEGLSHRLLKTPKTNRSLKVKELIGIFESYAKELVPGQEFHPMKIFRIRVASWFDRSFISRKIFHLYKKAMLYSSR
jgi:glycosyltransferase involved in cell wall biosynthesis